MKESHPMRQAKFNKTTTIHLSQRAYDKIKAISDEENVSFSEYLRSIIDDWIASEEMSEIIHSGYGVTVSNQ